jgi:BON domain
MLSLTESELLSDNQPFNRQIQRRELRIMKKSYIVIRFLVVLMMIAAFVACASTPKQESTGEYIDDSVITTKIKTQLASDDFLKSFQISVESRKGIVQLSGFVDSQKAVDKAGQIAGGVEGVKSVRNDLIVK